MIAISFKEQNKEFNKEGMMNIPAHWDGSTMVSCWQLSKEDLEIINKTGKVWVSIMCPRFYPMKVMSENPFVMPRPIDVTDDMMSRVFLVFFDDNEIVAIRVGTDEHKFEIHQEEERYIISSELKDLPGQRFDTIFGFWEPLKILGKADELHGVYEPIAHRMKWPEHEILILERVNKTDLSKDNSDY